MFCQKGAGATTRDMILRAVACVMLASIILADAPALPPSFEQDEAYVQKYLVTTGNGSVSAQQKIIDRLIATYQSSFSNALAYAQLLPTSSAAKPRRNRLRFVHGGQ